MYQPRKLRHIVPILIICHLLVDVSKSSFSYCSKGPCTKGQYLDKESGQCQPCALGITYMDEEDHTCFQCKWCSTPQILLHKIILRNCTLTTNSEIGCRDGYYLMRVLKTCLKCTTCTKNETEKAKCGPYEDRVCQAIKNIVCKAGYYKNTQLQTCEPCTTCKENEVETTKCGLYNDAECQTITTPVTKMANKNSTMMSNKKTQCTFRTATGSPDKEAREHKKTFYVPIVLTVALILGVFTMLLIVYICHRHKSSNGSNVTCNNVAYRFSSHKCFL